MNADRATSGDPTSADPVPPFAIRPLAANAGGDDVYRLWREALGSSWPLSPSCLEDSLGLDEPKSVGLGAFLGHFLIGTGVAEIIGEDEAALVLIAVAPAHRRRGVGASLLRELKRVLGSKGIQTMTFGAGASKPLWHGVPISLPGALAFFERHGGVLDETSYDLVRDISDFRAPAALSERARQYGVSFETLRPQLAPSLLAFEQAHFPFWHPFFSAAIADGSSCDVLVARCQKEIVGSALLSEAPDCPGAQWEQRLGSRLGAFGIIGVAPSHRRHGVGLAFAAYATQRLRNRGVRTCFLHWTDLRDWYGQLGFAVWGEYRLGTLPIAEKNSGKSK